MAGTAHSVDEGTFDESELLDRISRGELDIDDLLARAASGTLADQVLAAWACVAFGAPAADGDLEAKARSLIAIDLLRPHVAASPRAAALLAVELAGTGERRHAAEAWQLAVASARCGDLIGMRTVGTWLANGSAPDDIDEVDGADGAAWLGRAAIAGDWLARRMFHGELDGDDVPAWIARLAR
jgi:hypothetical protein